MNHILGILGATSLNFARVAWKIHSKPLAGGFASLELDHELHDGLSSGLVRIVSFRAALLAMMGPASYLVLNGMVVNYLRRVC
jgi:hypothetical protein